MQSHAPIVFPTPERVAALDRLGDEIAVLSAHLDAATAHLRDLIREFDARGGWNSGFHSCSMWCGRSTCYTPWLRQPARLLTTPPSEAKARALFVELAGPAAKEVGRGDPVTTRRAFIGTLASAFVR